ncbi:GNAT family N-acetyltransferase [Aestuariibaculum suncheonense]|uniref:GNAT family N-acetyltransferase n=1 Tax=Aestuariibaculum suncheonense TaxID=1028745 RepID=A0A8J6Q7W3_9FLAO|nr:GNAT family N-acetyltransferase [Aestuariibaculum suncheonense]MBD0835481.1 GNAT family N-acetyltransferase [Aestuariibaculum suncheonense]
MSQYKTYETERLVLKPTDEDDSEFVLALLNTPKWLEYIGDRQVKTFEDAQTYIKNRMSSQLERLGFGNYTLIRKTDKFKIGSCGLYDREGLEGIDIGFAFLPEYEKQGYAFEAANKVKQLAFEEFGLTEIHAITIKENTSSQRLLEKLGLRFEKIINIPGDDENLLLYSIKKEEHI